ncbi:MAG: Coenzyme F420 hydrogenase/dehydrogenase, beta subunit C-terminal domain [Candidatus Geothermarchaeales archaeon]
MYPGGKVFSNLILDVVKRGRCSLCGACVASCPPEVMVIDGTPRLTGKCVFCGVCYNQCPRIELGPEDLEFFVFHRHRTEEDELGIYTGALMAKSRISEVSNVAQDGGIVSSLLIYMIEEGLADAAIVTTSNERWDAVPYVASSRREIIEAAGTKYTPSPNLLGVADAVQKRGKKRVALVGTPCQVQAARKMQYYPQLSGLGDKILFTIGLFCMESFPYDKLIDEYLVERWGIDIGDVGKFMISKGRFIVRSNEGEEFVNVRLKEVKPMAMEACHICEDFTAELSDVSVGSVGAPEGWSSVLIRSDIGKKIFEEAREGGYIESKPIERLDSIIKLASRKKTGAVAASEKPEGS